jgi:nanoRNase/pAp phosphatase (c-di-AMP/oligoRNAs hydrolase)
MIASDPTSRVPRATSANLTPGKAAASRGPVNAPNILAAVQPIPQAERVHELEKVLAETRDEAHLILLGGHPDPDAIASAMAHRRLCERLGVSATIAHVLPISRSENRALVKLLNVPMVKVAEPSELTGYRYLALVDASACEQSIKLPPGLEVLTIVDHHRPPSIPKAPFVDIRHDVGATCTIYAEYAEHGSAPFGTGNDDSDVATAMFFGIQTDTDDFAYATPADFRAAAYLKPFVDAETLSRVGRRAVSAEAMAAIGRALADIEVVRDFAIAGVGHVSATNRDAIPMAADFLLRREDIDTVLVFGIVEDRVDGSLRTRRASVDPAVFMQNVFGEDSDGRPYGGGRADMGGFRIPLGLMAESGDEENLWRMVREVVHKRVARVVPELEKRRDTRSG